MTPTSDERREVAARLRDDNHGYGTEYDFFLHALGMSREGCGPCDWAKVHKRLADLLDPTCEVMEVPDNDEFMIRVVSGFMCKRCGHEAIVERNCDGSAEPPKYCPHCGARVVDEDGD